MKLNLAISTFIVIHLSLGRKASIPYGLASGLNIYLVSGFALILDTIFSNSIYFLSGGAVSKIKFLRKIKKKIISVQEKILSSHVALRCFFMRLGRTGVVLVTTIPFTGGINISIPLAHALNLNKRESLLLLLAGNFFGCLLITLGVKGVLVWLS